MAKGHYDGLDIKRLSADGELPISLRVSPSPKAVILNASLAVALLIFALNLNSMLPDYLVGGADSPARQWLPVAVGVVALLYGARALFGALGKGASISVDRNHVNFRSRTPLGKREWTEALASYKGVRWKRFAIHEERASDRVKTRYRHVIELVHPDVGKTVPLFARETGKADRMATLALASKALATKEPTEKDRAELGAEAARLAEQGAADEPKARWEAFAALLELPAIDARDGAEVMSAPGEVNAPLEQPAGEGTMDADPGAKPPSSLAVRTVGDSGDPESQELQVLIRAGNTPKPILWALSAAGVVLLVAGLVTFSLGSVLGGLLFGGLVYGIRYAERAKPRQLTVTHEALRYVDPMVSSRSFTMPLAAITAITIRDRDTETLDSKKTPRLSGKELLISTARNEKRAAGGASEEDLVWLRDKLSAVVARTS